ncbi:MAG: kelch repeat-containing protein [Cystobacter sp.]
MALCVLGLAACSGGEPPSGEGESATRLAALAAPLSARPRTLHSENKVLILASTVTKGMQSVEARMATSLGYSVQLVTDDGWRALTTDDFASYRAIILGDKSCSMAVGLLKAAEDTTAVWGPVVDGNVIVVGTDPVYHGKDQVTLNAVKFAASESGKTGMYVGLSCYYHGVDPSTREVVPVLSPFGTFEVTGVGCYNDAHIVASHSALAGLTDSVLSNWGCSVHEAFMSYPESAFIPLVIARDEPGHVRWPGSRDFADGSHGVPYVLARGAVPVSCGDAVVQYPEQCDTGAKNGVPGTACSASCRLHWCGDGSVDPGEECDTGASNGSGTCSAACRLTTVPGVPPVARCQDLELSAISVCGATGSVDNGSYDPDGDLVGCTQSPSGTFGLGTTEVTLTCTDAKGQSASCTASVTVSDTTPPFVNCAPSVQAECSGPTTPVEVPDATVTDACEFGYTRSPEATVYPVGGPYPVEYRAFDSSGNTSVCTTQVRVVDTVAPSVALRGPATQSIACGTAYADPGATASDVCVEGASLAVTVSGAVNTQVPGTYVLTYVARDPSGNPGSATRQVTVTPSDACGATEGGWHRTGSLALPRLFHTATLLLDGRVLVAGGFNTSSELYDPATRAFSTTGSNLGTHRGHSATRLQDGRVLVAGGTSSTSRPSAELYVPETGKWQATGRLTTPRFNHRAVRLRDGRVLVTGGFDRENNGTPLSSAELYDPATGTWSATGSLAQARGFHTLTVLENGRVLVAGGSIHPDHNAVGDTLLPGAELYDPATGTWTSTGSLNTGRGWHTATLLPGGRVLVVGGVGANVALSATAELYDPVTGTWSITGAMKAPRRWHTATLLPNGEVLVAGGYHQQTGIQFAAERYNPATGTWSETVPMHVDRYRHTATLLGDGTVLVVGGASNNDQSSAEYYDPRGL